ncbi:MAG TPA: hypothetical protein VFC19_15520 [Candidatus Limnocylindrales bacterium]|nr:hypothetical protein [Candidatus Limnocylindrales bacterium]
MTRLDEMVWTLLHDATPFVGDDAGELLRRLDEPLRIGVTGGPGTGKSTLINALLGSKVALSDSSIFIWYQEGPTPSVEPAPGDGLIVSWPARALRHMTLVESRDPWDVDCVLHLDPTGEVPDSPAHTIGVLSRADEVAGGRIDALVNARRLARRLSREPGSRTTVVAFSGLLAFAGQTLTEAGFSVLAQLAARPRAELDHCLLSADRVLAVPLPTSAIFELLGLHGLRLATTLIRAGSSTRARLCEELVRRSGLTDLQDRLSYHFLERRDVLKAHSALRALRPLAAEHPQLLVRIEHILANAHEFRELDLLTALRNGSISVGDDAQAGRLVGIDGTDPAARLGLGHDAGEAEVWELTGEAVRRWRTLADDASLSGPQRRAARVVVRSCEGILGPRHLPEA